LEKEAKTFANGAAHGWRRIRPELAAVAKVFWFFFSRKNVSFPLLRRHVHCLLSSQQPAGYGE
jgi:hypothetical protein